MSTSEELLEEIVAIWQQAKLNSRDASLEVGRRLHCFVKERLREGDGLTNHTRRQRRCFRARAVECAAERLGLTRIRVSWLIGTSMAADLLSGGNIGELGWGTISAFVRFIKRHAGSRRIWDEKINRPNGPLLSETEEWGIRPEFADQARELFQTAVRDKWTRDETLKRLGAVHKPTRGFFSDPDTTDAADKVAARQSRRPRLSAGNPTPGRANHQNPEELPADVALKLFKRRIANGSPRDVAELLFELVKEAENPAAVVDHLGQLVREEKPRKRITLADAM